MNMRTAQCGFKPTKTRSQNVKLTYFDVYFAVFARNKSTAALAV